MANSSYQQQQQQATHIGEYQRWSNSAQQQYQQQFQQQRSQQQKMAWQEQQSTSYSASRRKTWAESSVFHGGIAFAGATHYHDHGCPASGLGTAPAAAPVVAANRSTYKF